jgi:hypothetical protein
MGAIYKTISFPPFLLLNIPETVFANRDIGANFRDLIRNIHAGQYPELRKTPDREFSGKKIINPCCSRKLRS